MKKIYNNWRSELLNEFAPSYGIEDEEGGIEQYITPSSDLVQKAVQDAIDDGRGYHASGRPINSSLLQGLLKENDAREIVDSMKGLQTDDYLRKITITPPYVQSATGHLNDIRHIYNAASRSKGKTVSSADVPLGHYMNGLYMDTKRFQEFKESISNATEAYGHLIHSSRYDIVQAIRLFTGESVATVRNPPNFDPKLAKALEGSMYSKREILEKILPADIMIKGTDYYIATSFMDLINHARRVINIKTLPTMTSNKGKEEITAYFDRVIDIVKNKFTNPELTVSIRQEKGFTKIAELLGHSTKSRKYQEFLVSLDRMASLIPLCERFYDYHTKFLSVPDQEDYEVANNILKKLAKKPVKGSYRVYRGMYVKGGVFPKGIKPGMEFNFYDISSWSTDNSIAKHFSNPPDGEPEAGDKSIIFYMDAKRGTYINFYSAFNEESEFITGGKVRILNAVEEERQNIIYLECEQL